MSGLGLALGSGSRSMTAKGLVLTHLKAENELQPETETKAKL